MAYKYKPNNLLITPHKNIKSMQFYFYWIITNKRN